MSVSKNSTFNPDTFSGTIYGAGYRKPGGPATPQGKAVAARNATTHGLFARDVVLPSLGEDPEGYKRLEAEWMAQLPPRTLLERHYVEKIAAASWRLRRLHRWQAQIFEDDTLTEDERLDKLDKALRHETALHRQIDTAVKMLARDAPQLFARRVRDQVLEDTNISERECREDAEDERCVDIETRSRLYRIRKATENNSKALADAPLDTGPGASEVPENGGDCRIEPLALTVAAATPEAGTQDGPKEAPDAADTPRTSKICKNELPCLSVPRNAPSWTSTEGYGGMEEKASSTPPACPRR